MNFKRILLIFSILLATLMCISSVVAADIDNNMTDDSLSIYPNDDLDLQSDFNDDSVISSPQTIIVGEDGFTNNEMNNPTIQTVLDDAKAGDTIIIKGSYYEHCHFVVKKQLTIITNGTTLSPCGNPGLKDSAHQGIFYITSKASGTTIDGFSFVDNLGLSDEDAYGIFINGASDVIIKNCKISTGDYADSIRLENANNVLIQNTTLFNSVNGIKIKNSKNTIIRDSNIINSNVGANIVDSTQTTITSCNITNNKLAGVLFSGNSSYLTISYNNITTNGNGINLTSSAYVYIISNAISFNKQNGVYVNCNITKIEIKGNFFNQNRFYEIYDDHRVKNLFKKGGESLQIITNNYMVGDDDTAYDRPIWRQVYDYKPGAGSYSYDAVNDVYKYTGSGSDYDGHQSGIFLGYVFEVNEYMDCPNIYYKYGATPWSKEGDDWYYYLLKLSDITQIRKGVYSISIIDGEGNIATDISSVPITFYLNKDKATVSPQEGDVYKTVIMKNGTATVKFDSEDFLESGNVVMACAPGIEHNKYSSDIPYKTLKIDDVNIPGEVVETNISVSNLNTYPDSNVDFVATLTDLNGTPIEGMVLTFDINSKKQNATTDENGTASIKISESKAGSYTVSVSFVGDEIDFKSSNASASVSVKKLSTVLSYSNVYMIPNMAEYYSITLKDQHGNPIYDEKITFKVNGKTYNAKTNKNGVAKVKLKFSKETTYKVSINYAGSNKYNSVSKTAKINVKYSSKTSKITAPTVTITPKTSKTYTVTLKDGDGKGIAKQKITIKINGKTYSKTTNSKGQASITVKFSSEKSYKVNVNYPGSKVYKKASATGTIKVAKTTTKVTAPKVNVLPNTDSIYTVTLKTSDGKALYNQKITIKFNGKTYTKTTNSKGQVSLKVNLKVEKTYSVSLNYAGSNIYKAAKATGSIKVSKGTVDLTTYDMTYALDSSQNYSITLRDSSGKALPNEKISFGFNNGTVQKTTNSNGIAFVNLNSTVGTFEIETTYIGSDKYLPTSVVNTITISNKTNAVFINENLPNGEIQSILDACDEGTDVEFIGDFVGVCLDINKGLNIFSQEGSLLTASSSRPVLNIKASNVNITKFAIVANESDAVVVNNVNNVNILSIIISNSLDHAKLEEYLESSISMPGYGISIINSTNVKVSDNAISLFESAVFAENSSNLVIEGNLLRENNYGVKYGVGVEDTQIINNFITENIGLYTLLIPEGPRGYGIFLNNSAVNVSICDNNITWNHLGISIDSNYSTGIVINRNWISDNVLEGMRFNAGYDLAENAVEPIVTDNAIYRNARGPSMMILGELSANPEGIYGGGLTNDSLKLKLGLNWYGRNQLAKWDYDTGIVGYGTMCPRISTSPIQFKEITCITPGTYSITFYKNDEIASNLPVFEMYATLNNETEVVFNVVDGVGTFKFDSQDFASGINHIDISIGSLKDENRYFEVAMSKTLQSSEIPVK